MRKRIHAAILTLACCALLALPASGFAQSPTGDVYSGIGGQQQTGGGGDLQGNPPPTPPTTDEGETLPFTGFEFGIAALLGAGLLGTGLVLRRTVRQQTQA